MIEFVLITAVVALLMKNAYQDNHAKTLAKMIKNHERRIVQLESNAATSMAAQILRSMI
jgi:hypothetical protein